MRKPPSQISHPQVLQLYTSEAGRVLKPKKHLGQHFLRQKSVLNKIIEAADLKTGDLVLEIGPGLGVLTEKLAQKAGRVVTIEKDPRLIPLLKEKFKDNRNVEIVEGDARELVSSIEYLVSSMKNIRSPSNTRYNPSTSSGLSRVKSRDKIPDTKYKVVANLPYYAATHIIRCLLELPCPPELMVLMVQKEVAQRICPSTGSGRGAKPKMNLLAISVQFYAEAKIISYVSKNAFWPKPKVDSAIIKITPQKWQKQSVQESHGREKGIQITRTNNCFLNEKNKRLFFKIVKAGFSQPRKQLVNNLASGLGLPKSQIKNWLLGNKLEPNARAESLSLENWLALTKTFVLE
ncbi:MAG: 16S rRNA (adenine(1518)-N(6)/adenine(1519)-N(6))-dimethyltransferase RsmA [bacterium]|nr:16S rRNA (adenine(1518)-N(6)/adenine(1519)-N(6))-dimethyltransferase RsmA [bacterium]